MRRHHLGRCQRSSGPCITRSAGTSPGSAWKLSGGYKQLWMKRPCSINCLSSSGLTLWLTEGSQGSVAGHVLPRSDETLHHFIEGGASDVPRHLQHHPASVWAGEQRTNQRTLCSSMWEKSATVMSHFNYLPSQFYYYTDAEEQISEFSALP